MTTASSASAQLDERRVRAAVAEIPDPEIPAISVVDLGIIHRVEASPQTIRVEILPTFVGCPALEAMRVAIAKRLHELAPDARVEVEVTFETPWTSDRITPEGRHRLAQSGFAPPVASGGPAAAPITLGAPATCPYCGSRRTILDNAFGPTLCRSIYYCTECRQPFEQFKTV